MKLDFAFVSDAALLTERGLFSVLGGGFDTVKCSGFPATYHLIACVVRLRFDPGEFDVTHKCIVELFDPDGALVPKMKIELPVRPSPHPRYSDRSNVMTLHADFQQVPITKPGDYVFRISCDGVELGQIGIEVTGPENLEAS